MSFQRQEVKGQSFPIKMTINKLNSHDSHKERVINDVLSRLHLQLSGTAHREGTSACVCVRAFECTSAGVRGVNKVTMAASGQWEVLPAASLTAVLRSTKQQSFPRRSAAFSRRNKASGPERRRGSAGRGGRSLTTS